MAHFLLVDDNDDLVECMAELLRHRGHDVRTASTREEGLDLLRAGPLPDAVVLDIDMPVLDGPAMAHQMLVHDAGEEYVPLLLVSARADLALIAARIGTPYFLAKPCDVDSFLALVNLVIRERMAPCPLVLVTAPPTWTRSLRTWRCGALPLKATQELLGHSTIEMTMRYAHLAPTVKRDAVAQLDAPVPRNFGQLMGSGGELGDQGVA